MSARSADRDASIVQVDFGSHEQQPSERAVAVRRTRSGRWLVLEIEGEVDLQAIPQMANVLDEDPCLVVLDLDGITFMDCSGLRFISTAHRWAIASGGCVRLVSPSRQVLRLLCLTGLLRAFPKFDTVEDATSLPVAAGGYPGTRRRTRLENLPIRHAGRPGA